MEVQCWDGDGIEPDHIRRERESIERQYEIRKKKVGKRLADRERRQKMAKLREKSKVAIRCIRFEMRREGNRAHFKIVSLDDPRSLIFFAGWKFKEMTLRYPETDSADYPMRMPVVYRAIKPKVIQMHCLVPMEAAVEGRSSLDEIFDSWHPWRISLTIEFEDLINDSARVYKAFRESICLPIQTSQESSCHANATASASGDTPARKSSGSTSTACKRPKRRSGSRRVTARATPCRPSSV